MFANIFTTLIVQPIFNLLALIYALIPGHNFGLAIILFTIVIRLLMWPLVKRQLNHAKALRELQPELKKIKAAAKGDRQKESQLTMELYKEKEINPFASIGILLVQLPIFISLYSGLNRIIHNPHEIISFSYPILHHFGWMQTLAHDISKFDNTLFGVINLTRSAMGPHGIYWPAMVIVVISALAQYLQSKQLMPHDKEARSLKQILSESGKGKTADQQEVAAATGRATLIILPVFIFIISVNLPAALPLYWFVSSAVAYFQQSRILHEDAEEADALVDQPAVKQVAGGVTVRRETLKTTKQKTTAKKPHSSRNKRRKK